jgi:PadR family transcriptional regulator PadR
VPDWGTMQNFKLLQGTVDLLILKILELGPEHGLGVSDRISEFSFGILLIGQGSLYPALQRMEELKWIESRWGISENKRRARFYSLTPAGRKRLETEIWAWEYLSGAIDSFLRQVSKRSA